ncbi:MAG: hypothetical protein Q7J34_10120 [Bacteroidales bacterium]|nr:hypothetical protein [Bacteroidales bacterium]
MADLLVSRELEKEDFQILKNAYLKVKILSTAPRAMFSQEMSFIDTYKLLFFQHFLDLTIKDEEIGNDLIGFYSTGINCSFENDILKSTRDFINAIAEIGYMAKSEHISSYLKGLSISNFNNTESLYKIIFDGIGIRKDQFKIFEIIHDDKESRLGKSNFGKILKLTYSSTKLSAEEKAIIDKINEIIAELENEKQEKKAAEDK